MLNGGTVEGFAKIISQDEAKDRLKMFAALYAKRDISPEHILLVAPEGYGKRTLARAFAEEIGRPIQFVDASDLQRRGDLSGIVTNLRDREVLLVSNLQLLRSEISKALVPIMNQGVIEILIGAGPSARKHVIDLHSFTLIGTVPHESECPPSLRRGFSLTITLKSYSVSDLKQIAVKLAAGKGITLDESTVELVTRSIKNPGELCALIERISRVAEGRISEEQLAHVLSVMGIPSRATSGLNGFANLQELSGIQFEKLIVDLLQQMGFFAETTKVSGDGGVDVVAFLEKPVIGGRYLFQCKRFALRTC